MAIISNTNPNDIDDVLWLRQTIIDGIPADYRNTYFIFLNRLIQYYKELIKDIISNSGNIITFPMTTELLENYLTGFNIEFIPFDKKEFDLELEGFWEQNNEDKSVIRIYYNLNCSLKKQRFTKIHELMHFCQSIDDKFQQAFDGLILNEILPNNVIEKLLDKATDKATAIYLMPNNYFVKKYYEIRDIQELSEYFQVSAPSIIYRIKECGLPVLLQVN